MCAVKWDVARKYTLGRRAAQQAATRQRIVEAAVALHGSIGPAATSFSLLAERAGVQRHTVYAHFPDERSLFLACSGHHMALHPMPDPAPWTAIADRRARLRTALGAVYGHYERTAEMTANVLRDAERDPVLREVVEMRNAPHAAAWAAALGADDDPPATRAMLRLALGFHAWRALAVDAGLGTAAAAETMAAAIPLP